VLTALQRHPTLERIHFSSIERSWDPLLSLSGLEVLLRSQDSKVKELILEQVDSTRTVGLHPVMQELGRNTTVTDLSILDSVLSIENVHQLKVAIRGGWSQELRFLGQCNRLTPLLKASDPPGASPELGIWSRALAIVTTESDVLFHVLRNKPKLVGSAGSSQKRKRNNQYRVALVWTTISVLLLAKEDAR
jgi:hypothetical protein